MTVYIVEECGNDYDYYKRYGIFKDRDQAIAKFEEIVDSGPHNYLIQYRDYGSGESLPYVDLWGQVLSVTAEEVK